MGKGKGKRVIRRYRGRIKGIRYIAGVLRRYRPGYFRSYGEALAKAREVYGLLEGSGEGVSVRRVLGLVRRRVRGVGRGVGKVPVVEGKLLELSYYFELVDYPVYIARSDREVYFVSKLFPAGRKEIRGGELVDYYEYFADYVNYMNRMAWGSGVGSGEMEWMVRCTEPYYNPARRRWESEIISVDSTGDRFDYGFNPRRPKDGPEGVVLPAGKKAAGIKKQVEEEEKEKAPQAGVVKVPEEEEKEGAAAEIRKRELEVEMARQKNIEKLLGLYTEGRISKEELMELMRRVEGGGGASGGSGSSK